MWLTITNYVKVRNISENEIRVLTKDGKKTVWAWEEFITTEKEVTQLLRMYGYLFEIVSNVEENDEIENEENTEETENNENTENNDESNETEENTENTENVENDEQTENEENNEDTEEVDESENADWEWEKTEIELLREAYFEKYNAQVPVNKRNDVEWIKSKL